VNAVKYRQVVYGKWGFERKLSLGKGLNILSGPSGTGLGRLAAEILAGANSPSTLQDRPLNGRQQIYRRNRKEFKSDFSGSRELECHSVL
jgi:hypothetical protein